LSELIASNQEAYEEMAVDLAHHPRRLVEIKQKLSANRLRTALFDSRLFTKQLEVAYTQIYERYQADLSPAHIYTRSDRAAS
jgi:protein O-GlcNAc transferase